MACTKNWSCNGAPWNRVQTSVELTEIRELWKCLTVFWKHVRIFVCENKNLGVVFMEITSLTPKNEWKSKICAQNLFQRLPLRWAISARSHTHTKTPQINIMWNPLFVSNLTHTKVNGWTERICRNLFRWNRGSKLLFDFWLDSVLRLQRLLEVSILKKHRASVRAVNKSQRNSVWKYCRT